MKKRYRLSDKILPFFFCFLLLQLVAASQPELTSYNANLFTQPLHYNAHHTKQKITVDGLLSEPDWKQAKWSDDFVDIEGSDKSKPAYTTKVKMLWDDSCLYVAASLQEPQLNASLHRHDTIIFLDNDFEVFIDPDNDTHNYFEIEVNPFNTIFDLFLPKPYRNGGDALIGYNVEGLQTAVHLRGTVNNSTDTDSGWMVEMAIPFRSINLGFRTNHTPGKGSFYRINFSRVEWLWDVENNIYTKQKDSAGRRLPENNWVWSAQGVVNMHYPERWGYVFFAGDGKSDYQIPEKEAVKKALWLLYYKQQDYYKIHQKYARPLKELQMSSHQTINNKSYLLLLSATDKKFVAVIRNRSAGKPDFIDEEGNIR